MYTIGSQARVSAMRLATPLSYAPKRLLTGLQVGVPAEVTRANLLQF